MQEPLKILMLEGLPEDAKLIEQSLKDGGFNFCIMVVEGVADVEGAVQHFNPDIILSNHSLPSSNAVDALKIIKRINADIPFILLTDAPSEKLAIKCLEEGADDYILKCNLMRLPSAIARAMREKTAKSTNKKVCEELKKSQENYRQIVETAQEGIWAIDENYQTLFVNHTMAEMLEYTIEEMAGKSVFCFLDDQGKDIALSSLQKIRKGKKIELEFRFLSRTGKEIWTSISANPLYEENVKYVGAFAMITDITQRKKVENELKLFTKKLEQQLKETADYKYALDASSIVAITDQKGVITYVNDNFCKISKYAAEELIGMDHRMLNSGYHSKEFIKDLWLTIANGLVWRGEFKNKAKDGSFYWVDSTIVPFLNKKGKPYQYLSIRVNITKKKLAEEALKNAKDDLELKERRLKESQAITHLGSWEMDLENSTQIWSDELFNIFGIRRGDVLPSKELFLSFIHPEDFDFACKNVEMAFATLKDSSFNYRFIRQDGVVRHGHSEWRFEFDKKKIPRRLYGIVHDITEKKDAEEERLKSIMLAEESVKIKKLVNELNLHSQKIENSITYAKRLQDGIQVSQDVFNQVFQSTFIIDHPKEIVSGDFYWLNVKQNKILLALGDCTGHGVPGALLSTLGCALLTNIVSNHNYTAPDQLLKKLCFDWKKTFNHNNRQPDNFDGMEIACCSIDYEKKIIEFAGMGGSMYLVKNGELMEYKGENIGIYHNYGKTVNNCGIEKLICHQIPFEKNDCIYLFSDGYADQFGGPCGEDKFTKRQFKNLIINIQQYAFEKQGQLIDEAHRAWKGNHIQIDDILVMGIQL